MSAWQGTPGQNGYTTLRVATYNPAVNDDSGEITTGNWRSSKSRPTSCRCRIGFERISLDNNSTSAFCRKAGLLFLL
jgi:hypothetical protein